MTVKVIALLALASALFIGGCVHGTRAERTALAEKLTRKDRALDASAQALRGAAAALRAQNQANERRIAEAKRAAKAAGRSEGIAAEQARQADAASKAYQRGLSAAAKRRPQCAALLSMDVLKECEL